MAEVFRPRIVFSQDLDIYKKTSCWQCDDVDDGGDSDYEDEDDDEGNDTHVDQNDDNDKDHGHHDDVGDDEDEQEQVGDEADNMMTRSCLLRESVN